MNTSKGTDQGNRSLKRFHYIKFDAVLGFSTFNVVQIPLTCNRDGQSPLCFTAREVCGHIKPNEYTQSQTMGTNTVIKRANITFKDVLLHPFVFI